MVSVLLALAVSGISSDAAPLSRTRSESGNKSLRRDLEFYCKEMCRVVKRNEDALALVLGQALFVLATVAMQHSNEYALIVKHLNDLLVRSTQALRAHWSLHFAKDAVPTPAIQRRTRLLQRKTTTTRTRGDSSEWGDTSPNTPLSAS